MRLTCLAVAVAIAASSNTIAAQTSSAAFPFSDTASLADTAGLRQYIDDFMSRDMTELHVPGAVVAIVWNGRVILLRGYGVADSARKTLVDPERTVFRVGSVSKPFTATAVMQLVEQRKLDLHVDVNHYLHDMQVAEAFGTPVTAADLLTHTAGFDVQLQGTAAPSESEVQPLGSYLLHHLPPRVRTPGNAIAYSNHGFALLGHIVEQISGESFDAYMKRHVLDPLGMASSSFSFTPAVELRAATGYEPRSMTGHRLAPPMHPNISPAASLNATASDMTRFMIAQLEGGVVDGNRILADSTVQLMQATHFQQERRMPGMAYGFLETNWRNEHIVFHSGGIRGFMSAVYLWPDQHLGLFVADNGYRGDIEYDVLFHLMARYIPGDTATTLKGDPAKANEMAKYAGFYRVTSQTQTNLEKGGGIRNAPLEVRNTGKGTISVFGLEFVETAPRFFRELHGYETLAFLEDKSGRPTAIVTTYPFPGTEVWTRVPFILTAVPSQVLFITTLIVALIVLVRPPGVREDKRWSPMSTPAHDMKDWFTRTAVVVRALAAAEIIFLALMYTGAKATGGMLYGVPWQMDAAGIVALIGALLLLLLIGRLAYAFVRSNWPRLQLAGIGAFAFLCCLFLASQIYWRLIGIQH